MTQGTHQFEQTPGDMGKLGVLHSTGSQRVRHDLAAVQQEQQQCITSGSLVLTNVPY